MATPLVIGPAEERLFEQVKAHAAKHVIDMPTLLAKLETPEGKREHMTQMNSQTVRLPFGWLVTFSIEAGHPVGTCRHLSVSSPAKGRVPSPEAVWMIAEHFGFSGGYEKCHGVWNEDLQRGDGRAVAINVVQKLEP